MKGQAALLTAAGIGVTLVCLLGINWLGPGGAILNLLTPVAAAYLSMRYGLRTGIVVVVVVSLLLLQLAPVYTLATYLGFFGIGSLLLPFLLQQRQPWDRAVFLSVVGSALVSSMMALMVIQGSEIRFELLVDQLIQAEVDQAMLIYRDSGFSESQLLEMQGIIDGLAGFIQKSFYGLYLAGALVVQALCLLILQRLKKNHYLIAGTSFVSWRLPAGLIWILILSGFALLAPFEALALTGRNLLAVLLPLYFLQGLAVVSSFLQRKAYSPPIKGLIYALLFILNPLPLIITGVGVFDLWIDFRRPRKKDI